MSCEEDNRTEGIEKRAGQPLCWWAGGVEVRESEERPDDRTEFGEI